MENRVFAGTHREVHVAGDLHGDYKTFSRVMRCHDETANESLLLFLGDYADRGTKGVEIITELKDLLDKRSDIVALKGNHEIYRDGTPEFSPAQLISEAELKCGSWEDFYHDIVSGFLDKLHIAAIINRVLFVHGGISSKIRSRADLAKREHERDLLWSDPSPSPGEQKSSRGAGVEFGEEITLKVLSDLGLNLMIRSHEPDKAGNGPFREHGGRVITTGASSTYGKPFLLKVDTENLAYETIYL